MGVSAYPLYFSLTFWEVPSDVLLALFPACTLEVNLHTIDTANKFTHFCLFISPLPRKHECKAAREERSQSDCSVISEISLFGILLTTFCNYMLIFMTLHFRYAHIARRKVLTYPKSNIYSLVISMGDDFTV